MTTTSGLAARKQYGRICKPAFGVFVGNRKTEFTLTRSCFSFGTLPKLSIFSVWLVIFFNILFSFISWRSHSLDHRPNRQNVHENGRLRTEALDTYKATWPNCCRTHESWTSSCATPVTIWWVKKWFSWEFVLFWFRVFIAHCFPNDRLKWDQRL